MANATVLAPVPAPAAPLARVADTRVHPHSHDADLASGHYDRLAQGRFMLVRTDHGLYFASIEVDSLLGRMHMMIELSREAAHMLARAQKEHEEGLTKKVATGLARRADAYRRGAYTTGYQDEMTTGAALPYGARHSAVTGAASPYGARHPAVTGCGPATQTTGYQDEMTTGLAAYENTGDLFGDIGHAVSDVVHTVEHVAAPVVHAAQSVANQAGHAIDQAAKAAGHAVSDVTKAAAKVVAKAHLGDINAGKFIQDVVNTAKTGVNAAGQVLDHAAHAQFQNVASDLAKGVEFVAKHVDLPKIVADAIPIPAVKQAAQSVIGLVDPVAKFGTAVEALRTGDVNKLKGMAQQELAEAQGMVSLVPGVGSGVSAAIGAAQALLDGGAPLEIALRAAYGAIPIPPGLRDITDTVLDAVIKIATGGNITDAALAIARDRIPSGIPRDVFDTLVNVIGHHQPIEKAAEQLAGHYVTQYTQGLGAALTKGLGDAVNPLAAGLLNKLPDPSTTFASFAPGLKMLTQAQKLAGSLGQAPAALAPLVRGPAQALPRIPMPRMAAPAPARRVVPLRLGPAH